MTFPRRLLAALSLVTATALPALAVQSDDFDANNLDAGLWSFVNPLGDGSVRLTGAGTADAHLELRVPEGPTHDPWQINRSVRVMQPAANTDLEFEARFLSEPSLRFQLQGLLVEQDEDHWLRFDAYHDGTALRLFSGSTIGGSSSMRISVVIASGEAAYLRVRRVGNSWTMEHSVDGVSWSVAGSYSQALTVSSAGVFAANHIQGGGEAPAFTGIVDYFFDTATPIVPEDDAAAPDTSPPLIHALKRAMQIDAAHILFSTDEPAMGTVEYGTSMAYELGSVPGPAGLYDHDIVLPSVVQGETYHYRVSAEDGLAQGSQTDDLSFVFDPGGPTVDVWYGLVQSMGDIGTPQPWANVLGNVSDPDGVASLTYSLNGAPPVNMGIGPDGRRLVNAGDFNADLSTADLLAGDNSLVFTALDDLGNETIQEVTVKGHPGTEWPLPYSVDWSTLATDDDIQDVAQVVDGKWDLVGNEVRAIEPGYDRLVAMGDTTWTDYEVLVPVTLHSTAGGHGVGILLRWPGHSDFPVVCAQPKCGYLPLGAILWYRPGKIEIYGNGGGILASQSRTLTTGTTYWFRGRVETDVAGAIYRLKVWAVGDAEPAGWSIVGQAAPGDPAKGSALLITHLAEASFGNVEIAEVVGPANLPPAANDDTAFVAPSDSVLVNVLANDFDTDGSLDSTSVSIATGPLHGAASVDPVTGVVKYVHGGGPEATDSLTYTVQDDEAETSAEATVTIHITEDPVAQAESDDFNVCVLDDRWTVENPLGDGTYALVGAGSGDAWLELTLPPGSEHDAWGDGGVNESIRVMQDVADTDFSVEAHWMSEPTGPFNDQGLLVEQDDSNWLRFDVFHNGTSLRLFVGKTIGGANSTVLTAALAPGVATHVRVRRIGSTWTVETSGDGVAYLQRAQFTQALNVTQVGVYAANAVNALAFTSQVDWFLDLADPMVGEDADLLDVQVDVVGDGTVQRVPDLPSYACDNVVELTAVPEAGWLFEGWSGDLSGNANPDSVTVTGSMNVTATFIPDPTSVGGPGLAGGALAFRGAQPNPFAANTRIVFDLPRESAVDVSVYDVTGRLVRRLAHGQRMSAGSGSVVWDGREASGEAASPGVYFCTGRAGGETVTGRLLRMR
jgi:regulation of enolase protein 1 (concanavalin A-like superfamily)